MKILEKVKFKLYEILKKYFDRDKIEKFPCFYINGSQTLPPPLNPLEEEETLRKLALENEEAKQTGIAVYEAIRDALIVDYPNAIKKYRLDGELRSPQVFLTATSGLFPEHRMELLVDEDVTLIGIADMITIKDGVVNCIDWKTDEDGIKFKSRYDMSKKSTKRLKYPM